MLSTRKETTPHDSIGQFMNNWETVKAEKMLEEIVFCFVTDTDFALKDPIHGINKKMKSSAKYTLDDLDAPDDVGYINIKFIEEPSKPLMQVIREYSTDKRLGEKFVMISIAFNISDPKIDYWRHSTVEEKILQAGIRTLAAVTETLANELKINSNNVLRRSEFPPTK